MAFDPSLLRALEALFAEEQHVHSFKKDAYLFQEGEVASNIFRLQSGKIQIGKVIPGGREITIRISKAMDTQIEMTLFEEDANYTMNARAIESGKALVIPATNWN